MAYDQLDPIGRERGDIQAALIACTIAQVFAGKGQHPRLKDFLLRFGPPQVLLPGDPDEVVAKVKHFMQMVKAMGPAKKG